MSSLWPSQLTVRDRAGMEIVLRGLRTRDRVEWEELRRANAEWLRPWEATNPFATSQLRFRQLVRFYDTEAAAGRLQPFVIEHEGRLIGQMQLFAMTWGSSRSTSAGYWVDQRYVGRGIAPLALAAAVDHAFLGLGLHRVEANVRPDNAASLRVVEKLGFRNEGLREKLLHIDGEWRDHLSFAVTVEDIPGGSMLARWNAR